MNLNSQIAIYSFIWILSLTILYFFLNKKKKYISGISYIYVANLSLIHFFGSVFFILPTYWDKNLKYTVIGFKYATIALISFIIGNVIYIYGAKKKKIHTDLTNNHRKILLRYERIPFYILILGIFLFVLRYYIRIATVNVFLSLSLALIACSLCLLTYIAYIKRDYVAFSRYIALGFSIPIITILFDGFLGVGINMLIAFILFVTNFTKLSIKTVFLLIITMYIGLSFYVNYIEKRDDLRQSVWGKASISDRIEKFKIILEDFEFINPNNENHLNSINKRLNQNPLVGISVEYVNNDESRLAKGETFKESIISLVPRIIWKDKPIYAGNTQRVEKYSGLDFYVKTVSVGMPQVMEMYINYGIFSLIIGFIAIGVFMGYLDLKSGYYMRNFNFNKFLLFFLPGLTITRPETPITESFSAAIAAFILTYLLLAFPRKYYSSALFVLFVLVTLYLFRKYYLPLI